MSLVYLIAMIVLGIIGLTVHGTTVRDVNYDGTHLDAPTAKHICILGIFIFMMILTLAEVVDVFEAQSNLLQETVK